MFETQESTIAAMPAPTSAYLVMRRDDGFGDVFPLSPGLRYNMGRVATNRIVLKDDLCSREHAEVYFADRHWRVRDNHSLNGTRVNGERLDRERILRPGDEVSLGRTHLLFVLDLSELPEVPVPPSPSGDSVNIKKRLGNTRFLELAPTIPAEETKPEGDGAAPQAQERHRISRDLTLLYRLALGMGASNNLNELGQLVLEGLLEGIPADAGSILSLKEDQELELVAHRHRNPAEHHYHRMSQFVSREVIASREAILAEDVSQDQHLKNRESLTELRATSLICAPVLFGERLLGLIHLYSSDRKRPLDSEDLEFAMAVAKQLGSAMHHLQRQTSLSNENRSLRSQLRVESELVGEHPSMKEIEEQIARVAGTSATVLIRGESGTGKELVARAIHYSSRRRDGPFVCLNCAALPETLLESELFGHERGAFTGATEKKIGKFEAADHGTIFLDEIGEMNTASQAKLLRILEGHPFERVGGHTPIRVDVRVVSATNQPLEQAIQSASFRRDLFFRLQVIEIRIPPLRERKSDVPILAEHFLKRFVRETGRRLQGFTPAALKKMMDHHWPGNVRELRNVVERAVTLGNGPLLDAHDIWLSSIDATPTPTAARPTDAPFEPIDLEEIEKRHILRTLEYTDWNKSQAAAILKIERSTLDRKIKLYELKK